MNKILISTLLLMTLNHSSVASNFVLSNDKSTEDHDHGSRDDHSEHSHEKKDKNSKKKKNEHGDHLHRKASSMNHKGHEDNLDSAEHDNHKESGEHDEHDKHAKHDDHGDHGEDHHDHGSSKAIGESKAITEVDEVKGLKLSPEAIKTMKIRLTPANRGTLMIAKSTLVTSKNIKGVYRFRDGFFKFLQASSVKEVNNKYKIKVKGITSGDQIVTNGLGLLRVSDIYSTDKSEYGHSH